MDFKKMSCSLSYMVEALDKVNESNLCWAKIIEELFKTANINPKP